MITIVAWIVFIITTGWNMIYFSIAAGSIMEGSKTSWLRMLAAEKMGLTKDVYGENQKYELWSQRIPEARKQLGLD